MKAYLTFVIATKQLCLADYLLFKKKIKLDLREEGKKTTSQKSICKTLDGFI